MGDQSLYGPDLLVAPVLEPGARVRRAYLPGGCRWLDPATGQHHEGGGWVELALRPDRTPVLLRERGSGLLDPAWFA